ncbi:hypothetical protein SAMN05421809_3696 [Natronorubrum daqingense]|uniref:Uncharacterized protein n=1 Tax=Natronorubrum daqingense TaxID=588898 RepID=A0A1N7G2S0_9EURY|nr:hypothetical protein SAMN05421809_3696 [Natronorubrum daqingense]
MAHSWSGVDVDGDCETNIRRNPPADTASESGARVCRVREASGRDDAFYLVRLWHHYFGVEYEANWLPYGPFNLLPRLKSRESHHGISGRAIRP